MTEREDRGRTVEVMNSATLTNVSNTVVFADLSMPDPDHPPALPSAHQVTVYLILTPACFTAPKPHLNNSTLALGNPIQLILSRPIRRVVSTACT